MIRLKEQFSLAVPAMRDLLQDVVKDYSDFVELRYHNKVFRSITAEKGKVERSTVRRRCGVGVRVLKDGTWGFAATGDLSAAGIHKAITSARQAAQASGRYRQQALSSLPAVHLAQGDFREPGIDDILSRPLEEKLALVLTAEAQARQSSTSVVSASCTYNEIYEEKAIVTTDGANVSVQLVRPEFRVQAVAEHAGQMTTGSESIGVTGGWECLFRRHAEALAHQAAATAVDLLTAPYAEGGRSQVILSPALVGLLVHEAIGHTVEADFVLSGSVAAGKLGQRVASDVVTLCDSGASEFHGGAGGSLPVDDEGVPTQRTVIIENGILKSYLHNRETAAHFGVEPTGNARAWEYADQPLIRMRNTYIEPGDQSLEEIIASTEDGFFLDGARNGQADSTAEFMFGAERAYRIKNGQLGELVRGVTLTGNAFEVLQSVDAVSRDFVWDLGSGHCGKGQPAKVDAGGPYIRCRAIVGGQQE
ncbi:MAG: TldD/PmbA family protein [Synechococcales cyanobacterium]